MDRYAIVLNKPVPETLQKDPGVYIPPIKPRKDYSQEEYQQMYLGSPVRREQRNRFGVSYHDGRREYRVEFTFFDETPDADLLGILQDTIRRYYYTRIPERRDWGQEIEYQRRLQEESRRAQDDILGAQNSGAI